VPASDVASVRPGEAVQNTKGVLATYKNPVFILKRIGYVMGYRALDEFPEHMSFFWVLVSWALENLICSKEIDNANG